MLSKLCILFLPAIVLSSNSFALNNSAIKTKWGYAENIGPSHWAQLNPHFAVCSVGKIQSPVNIAPKITDQTRKLVIHYEPASLTIVKDGDTSLMIGQEQTVINDGHAIQLNFPSHISEIINYNNEEYRLVQLHFHTPSENKLNGQSFPAEIHLVHQGANGKIVVIGVFMKSGNENPSLQKILDHIPSEKNKIYNIDGETISPLSLLPVDQKHYDFNGSLTTPPCSEGLQWIVMKDPITASADQITQLKSATQGNNARPTQPRNKRDIFFSE